MSDFPDFRQLDKKLAMYDADVGAAEAHGLLVAILLGDKDNRLDSWLLELVPIESEGDVLLTETLKLMRQLYQVTDAQLQDEGVGLEMYLPQDQGDKRHAEAIVEWCIGFLYGLGISGLKNKHLAGEDCQEAIEEIKNISQLDLSTVDGEEDAEALMQLEEFVRVAVLLIRENVLGLKTI